jgi:formate/nitrite transporter FocA (FNT family)
MAATGTIGGVDVMVGIMLMTVVTGALAVAVPEQIAHIGGSLVFGVGFVLIILGRSELFTENFLVPIAPVLRRLAPVSSVARLWLVTGLANLAGIFVLAAIFTRAGLVPPESLDAAGKLADTFAERDFLAALLSAIVAGTVMTLFTWLATAVELDIGRIAIALLIGFVLAAPSLNHAIVGFGEMSFGLLAGRTETAEWLDVAQNFPVAVLGNLLGGLGFVTLARVLQVRGEPAEAAG